EYIEILTQLATAINAVESPVAADPALEAIEILISLPCPDARERQQFVVHASTLFQRWFTRIDTAQFALLRSYGEELGVAVMTPSQKQDEGHDQTVSEWAALDGKRL